MVTKAFFKTITSARLPLFLSVPVVAAFSVDFSAFNHALIKDAIDLTIQQAQTLSQIDMQFCGVMAALSGETLLVKFREFESQILSWYLLGSTVGGILITTTYKLLCPTRPVTSLRSRL